MSTALVPLDTLGATIKAHITKGDGALDKAEQHYKAAGIHLAEAKERVRTTKGLSWSAFLNSHCGIRRRRADELIAIADGRTTLEEVRRQKRESVRASRERQREKTALRCAQSEPVGVIAAPIATEDLQAIIDRQAKEIEALNAEVFSWKDLARVDGICMRKLSARIAELEKQLEGYRAMRAA